MNPLRKAKTIFFSRDVLFTVTVIRWKTTAQFISLKAFGDLVKGLMMKRIFRKLNE